ncbi:conserved hypothetical protein [Burkholderiales bacterium 8X]|nr:conserved hypothetical protein [Burkholderiales bacterium 8X]
MSSRDQDPVKNDAAPDAQSGKTRSQQGGESLPRMPHERDESSDARQSPEGEATSIGKRAYKDEAGKGEDTSLAPVTDKVYNDQVRR